MTRIAIINGPNLNLLGEREPLIYGSITLEELNINIENSFTEIGFDFFQSNHEGEIIDFIQEYRKKSQGIIINAGGFTHTSVAIADAVKSCLIPVVEVHISHIFAREEQRHISLISKYAEGMISGLGTHGYHLAIEYLLKRV